MEHISIEVNEKRSNKDVKKVPFAYANEMFRANQRRDKSKRIRGVK